MNLESSSSKSNVSMHSIERMNEAYPSKEMLLRSNQKVVSVKKYNNLVMTDIELDKMTENMLHLSNSKSKTKEHQSQYSATKTNSRQNSTNAYSDHYSASKVMHRRPSQNFELKQQISCLKNTYTSKLGNGKVVGEYLPQIGGGQQDSSKHESVERKANSIRIKLSEKKQKNLSIPVTLNQTLFDTNASNSSIVEIESAPRTPTKVGDTDHKKYDVLSKEDEIVEDNSEESDQESDEDIDYSDEEEDDMVTPKTAEQKKKEHNDIQEWARLNGFSVAVDAYSTPIQQAIETTTEPKKAPKKESVQSATLETKPNEKVDKVKETNTQKMQTEADEAVKQSELRQEQKWLAKRFECQMKHLYSPPPCPLLQKHFNVDEPVRTGFNQGFIPIKIKNNREAGRYAQGPQIVVTTEKVYQTQLNKKENQELRQSKTRKRSTSKDINLVVKPLEAKDTNVASTDAEKQQPSTEQPDLVDQKPKGEVVEGVQQVIQQALQNSETSLRHLFYLEYKKIFPEGQANPIVFSRFGKQHYGSDEKFDPNNFQQLIRTCNLKKILRLNSQLTNKGERKFNEPFQFPGCDYYRPTSEEDRTLVFESRFESGNLQLVNKKSEAEYDLVLQNDINSKGHTQWFFFRVSNVKKGQKVKFNMLNMIKSKSLYNDGMKMLMYSEKRQEAPRKKEDEKGWTRCGEDLSYFQNNYRKENQPLNSQRCYFTFTFTHTFELDDDTVFFSYSLPYTYSDLNNDLCEIQAKKLNYVSRNTLCRTIAGNKCEYLTITQRAPIEVDKKKQGVVISARIHPGESNASWMMKGVIDFLISDDPKAVELRTKFVFKVIPMLNPDGVINGNYRCSLAGCDLNRRWKYPSELLHPTIYHTKKLISKLANERPLALYCDLHGHSRRKNIFFYGNTQYENSEASRVFPFLMSKISQPHYSYDYSKFAMCRSKEQTARIAMWRELGSKHPNIFTLEASFCGPKPVKYEPHRKRQPYAHEVNYHFNTQDFMDVGQNLCETLLIYRSEQESLLGLSNIEYQVQQFQIEKQNALELQDLIKKQQEITDKRTQITNTNTRNPRINQSAENVTKRDASKNQSNKKSQSKNKAAASLLEEYSKNGSIASVTDKKKKVKYNTCKDSDESDGVSDSEPSDDNLDSEQLMKLVPKKFGKSKYLKGVIEKKKVVVEEKKAPKRPKATLMPCMSSSKKERENKLKKENESAKKPHINRSVTAVLKRGGKARDVGTQIHYAGDGRNLSLMELDIMQNTGCKWSKIIYPGYRGLLYQRPSESSNFFSAEKMMIDSKIRHSQQASSSPGKSGAFMSNFSKEFNKLMDGSGLRNGNRLLDRDADVSSFTTGKNNFTPQKASTPLTNELIKNFGQQLSSETKNTSLMNLQQKIQDAAFNEPRSLIGSLTNNCDNNRSSSKKRKIMGLPHYDNQKIDLIHKFDVGKLETVHEKSTIVSKNTDQIPKKRQPSISSQNVTKKVLNGQIVQSNPGTLRLAQMTDKSESKIRNKSITSNQGLNLSAQKPGIEQKSSFTKVAQQVLNYPSSIAEQEYSTRFKKLQQDHTPKKSGNEFNFAVLNNSRGSSAMKQHNM